MSNAYRTIESPSLSGAIALNPIQQEVVESLFLLDIATSEGAEEIEVAVPVGFLSPCIMDESKRRLIFDKLGLNYTYRDLYRKMMTKVVACGRFAGVNLAGYLFSNKPNRNPTTDTPENPSELYTTKQMLLELHDNGLLPLKTQASYHRVSAAQAVDFSVQGLKSRAEMAKHLVKLKEEALHARDVDGIYLSLSEEAASLLAASPDLARLYDYAIESQCAGHCINMAKGRSVPPEVKATLDIFKVDWAGVALYFRYRNTMLWKETPKFSLKVSHYSRVQFDASKNYHHLVSVTVEHRAYEVHGIVNGKEQRLRMQSSAKVLDLKVDDTLGCEYIENNSMRTPRKGRIKTFHAMPNGNCQLTMEVDMPDAHGFDLEDVLEARALLSTSLPVGEETEKSIKRSQSVKHDMVVMGIDINAYPMLSYSIKRVSFSQKSDLPVSLPNGDTCHLHPVAEGRLGEKTDAYDQFLKIIDRIRLLQTELHEKGDPSSCAITLGGIRQDMKRIPKVFNTSLSGDHYKYLDTVDYYISAAISIATFGKRDEEAREIARKTAPLLRRKRQAIRKDLTNKILFEIKKLVVQHQVCLVVLEDFNLFPKDEDAAKYKKRIEKNLKMRGLHESVSSRLKEVGTLTMLVDPSYTSRTFKDRYWGVREKNEARLTPFIDGEFATPVDDDISAAQNLVIRAFNRHSAIHAVSVRFKGGKLVPILSKRKKGAFMRMFGSLELGHVPDAGPSTKKLYRFENKWIVTKPDIILKDLMGAQLTSGSVVTNLPEPLVAV